jgi:hypothetical protein
VKDLIKRHSKEVADADALELIEGHNAEDSDMGTKSDPNFESLEEIMEMKPPLIWSRNGERFDRNLNPHLHQGFTQFCPKV